MPFKIAVPNKGRLAEETLRLLRGVGLPVPPSSARTLIATSPGGRYQILFLRAQDIPEFVEVGAADVGITGRDLVEETGRKVRTLADLGYGLCRLVVAAPERSRIRTLSRVPRGSRVATSFPNLTRRYFRARKKKITLVPVSGAAEITPAIGVADLVVDLTQTGSTLKQNHLVVLDTILESWAVLIAGPKGLSVHKEEAEDLAHAFGSVRLAARKRYLMANVASAKVGRIVSLIPGLKSPTVVSLAEPGMVAVHAVVDEEAINGILPRLKRAGASGILVLPIERMVP